MFFFLQQYKKKDYLCHSIFVKFVIVKIVLI